MTLPEAEKLIAALRTLVMAQDSLLWFHALHEHSPQAPRDCVKQAWDEARAVDAEIR